MPEGDTIHFHAGRIRPLLEGRVPDEILTPHPRFARERWPERLAGQAVRAVDARGKHLFLRFDGGLTIHSHLRMNGRWRITSRSDPVPRTAWLVIAVDDRQVLQLKGPVLELMTDSRTRLDRRLAELGPDICAEEFDEARVLRRLREDDPTRPIGDMLLQQRVVAGIGNMWKCEACLLARVDPWRPSGEVPDDEVLAILRAVRPLMRESARTGRPSQMLKIYRKPVCPYCKGRVRHRGQWDDNRETYWCPSCQS